MANINKALHMQEEMNKFEAEINAEVPKQNRLINGGFAYPSTTFIPPQMRQSNLSKITYDNRLSNSISATQSTVISAPAKIAEPVANVTADMDEDDDVIRVLLATAASMKKEKISSQTSEKANLSNTDQNQYAVNTAIPPPSLANLSQPPPDIPVASKSISVTPTYVGKKKKYLRMAGGQVWSDETLNDWDPRPEVNDDTLTRVFSRFASFKKAKVIRDKRSNKSRGYGFVSFGDPDDFTKAMREVNGRYVGNRPIKLKKSDWNGRSVDFQKKKIKEKKKLGLKL